MKNKKTAIILYALYATLLVLIITFGSAVSDAIVYQLEVAFSKKNITDVTTDIPEGTELLAGKTYYPVYTTHGPFNGSPGLNITSLDPDYLTVGEGGRITANTKFEGDFIDARVRVKSAYDKDFEKILTFRFVKRYPEEFTVSYSVMGLGEKSSVLTVGVPVYVFASIKAGSVYNVTDREIIYDEEYFTKGEDGSLIPIKASGKEELSFGIRYGNGSEEFSDSFTVIEEALPTDFDEVLLNGTPADEFIGIRGESISVALLRNGEKIAVPYEISLEQKLDASRDGRGGMCFLTVGDKGLTLTLPSGFSKTVYPKIRNTVSRPILSDSELERTHEITFYNSEYKTVSFYFEGKVTYSDVIYEYDEDMMRFASTPRSFTMKPKKHGTTTVRLIIDDGYTCVIEQYTVHIKPNLNPLFLISHNVSNFVAKVLGHTALFGSLAIFSMNLFKYVVIEDKRRRFILYSLTALSVAVITEIIQLFIPDRTAGVSDILIDMLGFYLGTVALVILGKIIAGIKEARHRKADAKEGG